MANYEKSTLKDVKERLEAGHYTSLTGALRGIGRMRGLSDRQKTRAQNLAREHFGEEPEKPKGRKKKTKKKAAKKRTAKKKAAKKRTAKKTTRKKAVSKKGKARSKKASKRSSSSSNKRGRKSRGSKKEKSGASSSAPRRSKLEESQMKIGTYQQALEAMEKAKNLGVKESEVAKGAKAAQEGLTAVVEELCRLDQPPTEGEEKAAKALQTAVDASSSRGANGAANHENAAAPEAPAPPPTATPPQG